MTDPAGGAPTPPPPEPAPAAPPPAAAPPPQSNWQTPQPAMPSAFQPAAVAAGPAPGVTYADTVARSVAFIIDLLILWIPWVIISAAVLATLFVNGAGFVIGGIVLGVIYAIGTAAYFVYCWTR